MTPFPVADQNHVYLMPLPHGEYDLFAEPAPDERENSDLRRQIEDKIKELATGKPLQQIVAQQLKEFLFEDSLVTAGANDAETRFHFPDGMDLYLAQARSETLLRKRKEENRIEMAFTLAGGGVSMLFGDLAFPAAFAVYAAKSIRKGRAYDALLKTPVDSFTPDTDLARIEKLLEPNTLSRAGLARKCQEESLEQFVDFYSRR